MKMMVVCSNYAEDTGVGACTTLRKAAISFVMTVCLFVCLSASASLSVRPSAWNNSAPTGRIFMKFNIRVFLEDVWRRHIEVALKYDKTKRYLYQGLCTVVTISRSVLLRITNV
jgi:hypothetical protein